MIMVDQVTPKERLKFSIITPAGLFWIIHALLAIGFILAWIK